MKFAVAILLADYEDEHAEADGKKVKDVDALGDSSEVDEDWGGRMGRLEEGGVIPMPKPNRTFTPKIDTTALWSLRSHSASLIASS